MLGVGKKGGKKDEKTRRRRQSDILGLFSRAIQHQSVLVTLNAPYYISLRLGRPARTVYLEPMYYLSLVTFSVKEIGNERRTVPLSV